MSSRIKWGECERKRITDDSKALPSSSVSSLNRDPLLLRSSSTLLVLPHVPETPQLTGFYSRSTAPYPAPSATAQLCLTELRGPQCTQSDPECTSASQPSGLLQSLPGSGVPITSAVPPGPWLLPAWMPPSFSPWNWACSLPHRSVLPCHPAASLASLRSQLEHHRPQEAFSDLPV